MTDNGYAKNQTRCCTWKAQNLPVRQTNDESLKYKPRPLKKKKKLTGSYRMFKNKQRKKNGFCAKQQRNFIINIFFFFTQLVFNFELITPGN